jgi:hypothetical protein
LRIGQGAGGKGKQDRDKDWESDCRGRVSGGWRALVPERRETEKEPARPPAGRRPSRVAPRTHRANVHAAKQRRAAYRVRGTCPVGPSVDSRMRAELRSAVRSARWRALVPERREIEQEPARPPAGWRPSRFAPCTRRPNVNDTGEPPATRPKARRSLARHFRAGLDWSERYQEVVFFSPHELETNPPKRRVSKCWSPRRLAPESMSEIARNSEPVSTRRRAEAPITTRAVVRPCFGCSRCKSVN